MKIDNIDWDDLLSVESLSLEEERNTTIAVSDYLINNQSKTIVDEKQIGSDEINVVELMEFDPESKMPEVNKLDESTLFNLISEKNTTLVNPTINFPKTDDINGVFLLLDFLYDVNTDYKYFRVNYMKKESVPIYLEKMLSSLEYFGYLNVHDELGNKVYSFGELTKIVFEGQQDNKYISFVCNLGQFETIKDALKLQISVPGFDRITKDIISRSFANNRSIIQEGLGDKEITELINNMRKWYLAIRKKLIN